MNFLMFKPELMRAYQEKSCTHRKCFVVLLLMYIYFFFYFVFSQFNLHVSETRFAFISALAFSSEKEMCVYESEESWLQHTQVLSVIVNSKKKSNITNKIVMYTSRMLLGFQLFSRYKHQFYIIFLKAHHLFECL